MNDLKCGCGGVVKVDKHIYYRALPTYGVRCRRCGQQTDQFYKTENEAIEAWKIAMGEHISKVVEHDASIMVEGGYKLHRSEYLCSNCKKKVLDSDVYCSHCGSKLDWKL